MSHAKRTCGCVLFFVLHLKVLTFRRWSDRRGTFDFSGFVLAAWFEWLLSVSED